ncbi:MAG: hypothetical protein KGQ38_00290 [Actinomycetales bacterium]|nr:hypothetical protein [Actinomycetales bacterium]
MSVNDLLFSSRCFCGQPRLDICGECVQLLQIGLGKKLPGIDFSWSAGKYQDPLKSAIISYKSGDRSQTSILAQVLSRVLTFAQLPKSTLIPLPSTAEKVRFRGFDTIGILTKKVARKNRLDFAPVLRFTKQVSDQVGLDGAERNANLADALTATRPVSATVVLVDDVVTTGATVTCAAKALRIAGAQKIFLISLCRTEN